MIEARTTEFRRTPAGVEAGELHASAPARLSHAQVPTGHVRTEARPPETNLGAARGERGTVMMEYVVLNLFFIVTIIAAGQFFVGNKSGAGNFGSLGNALIQRYNLMLQVISMPYP